MKPIVLTAEQRKEAERRLVAAHGNVRNAISNAGKRKVTSRRVKS